MFGVIKILKLLQNHTRVLDTVERPQRVVVQVRKIHIHLRREHRMVVALEGANHIAQRVNHAPEANHETFHPINRADAFAFVVELGIVLDGVFFEIRDGVLDFVRKVKHTVNKRVDKRVQQIRRAPLTDFPGVFRDSALDVFKNEFPFFVEGNQKVRSRDKGNLLPARLKFFDAEAHGARYRENHFPVFFKLRTRPLGNDVFLRKHRNIEKRADEMNQLRVFHPHHLHPNHARTIRKFAQAVGIGKLVERIPGFVVANHAELRRFLRIKRRLKRQRSRLKTDFHSIVLFLNLRRRRRSRVFRKKLLRERTGVATQETFETNPRRAAAFGSFS